MRMAKQNPTKMGERSYGRAEREKRKEREEREERERGRGRERERENVPFNGIAPSGAFLYFITSQIIHLCSSRQLKRCQLKERREKTKREV
jgi:hypothetical protein